MRFSSICMGLWKRKPYESGVDERKYTRYEERYLKSKIEKESPQKWTNNHSHTKHHTKKTIILRPFFAIARYIREDCLGYRDISCSDTIDDTANEHPPDIRCKSRNNPTKS